MSGCRGAPLPTPPVACSSQRGLRPQPSAAGRTCSRPIVVIGSENKKERQDAKAPRGPWWAPARTRYEHTSVCLSDERRARGTSIDRVGSRRAPGARPWQEERAGERAALSSARSSCQGRLLSAVARTCGTAHPSLRWLGVLASLRFNFRLSRRADHERDEPPQTAPPAAPGASRRPASLRRWVSLRISSRSQ
jgi:hypothetical protein